MNNKNKKIYELKMKRMLYKDNKIYALNNIDSEKLDANSEFLIGSISKLYTIIVLLILNQDKIHPNLGFLDTFLLKN